jgi:hypothetical protein
MRHRDNRGSPRRQRGRPPITHESRRQQLVDAYSKLKAKANSLPPLLEREGLTNPDPESAEFLKLALLAEREGVLDSLGYGDLESVAAARERVKILAEFWPPGKPRAVLQLQRDHEAKAVIVAALPHHPKWVSLHHDIKHEASIPNSWTGFLKLLARLPIQHEGKTPKELAYEMGLSVPEPEVRETPRARRRLRVRRTRASAFGITNQPQREKYAPWLRYFCNACSRPHSGHTAGTIRLRMVSGRGITWRVCGTCLRDADGIAAAASVSGLRGAMVLQSSVRVRR